MKIEIAEAISELTKAKKIDREQLADILESVMLSMIKKKYGTADNFDVFVNLDKGEIEIYQNKVIVDSVTDEMAEIDLKTAQSVEPDLEIGDEFLELVDPRKFGRRLIASAKQNLSQKLRDLEKESILEEFQNRLGEIIIGDIRQVNRDEIYINIDKIEVVLPRDEQIQNERYRRGESIRAVVKEVRRSSRGPEIVVSRRDPKFLVRLLELEVPEIYDGIIEIKDVAREAGERAKIAVFSNDKRIDAVGACVGMKGIRIQEIVRELNNEKIDVINWNADAQVYISRALSPAKPSYIIVNSENKSAIAIIPDEYISLAIGKGGVNRRLASQLTGYEIETIKESDYQSMMTRAKEDLDHKKLPGIGKAALEKLKEQDIKTPEDALKAGKDKLMEIPGIGEKTAGKIIESVKNYIEK